MNVKDFLPKYPIPSGLPDPFRMYDASPESVISAKKEFADNRLLPVEVIPDPPDYLAHQKIVARLLSAHTLFAELLLVHEMGTGKSLSAIAAAELVTAPPTSIPRALVLLKGETLIPTFVDEIVFKVPDEKYLPEDFADLEELTKVRRKNKSVARTYTINTFEIFAKELVRLSDDEIRERYSNHIIIIDEVHHLRADGKTANYEQIHRMLHLVTNRKIIIMSGTPMKDKPEEIAAIMNLILPLSEQLPVDGFADVYLADGVVKETMRDELKRRVRGRVSFLRAMRSDTRKSYQGEYVHGLRRLRVVDLAMSAEQTRAYQEAVSKDSGDDEGFSSNARQASLAVFPDGAYGTDGFNKNMAENKKKSVISDKELSKLFGERAVRLKTHTPRPALTAAISARTRADKIANIRRYSTKYAALIERVLSADESCFAYCEYVYGSGILYLAALLDMLGFRQSTGGDKTPALRYAIITNATTSARERRNILDEFNSPKNMNGAYIRLLIGSQTISEGFSMKNVLQTHILTPYWNYSELSQAIARTVRVNSHKDLVDAGIRPVVKIYQYTNSPTDARMYLISEQKDVSIRNMERLLKEAAIDCALTKARNLLPFFEDGSRDCDYTACEYTCDWHAPHAPDAITYNLFYSEDRTDELVDRISTLFRTRFVVRYREIVADAAEYTEYEILQTLDKMIREYIPVPNKYGFHSYLHESNDVYFLISTPRESASLDLVYYTENPALRPPADHTLQAIAETRRAQNLADTIDIIFSDVPREEKIRNIDNLPLRVKETLLEGAILTRRARGRSSAIIDLITEHFSRFFSGTDVVVSRLLQGEGVLRCFDGREWADCDESVRKEIAEGQQGAKKQMETNPYGYYGLVDAKQTFYIRDVSASSKKSARDTRVITKGKNCKISWPMTDLMRVVHAVKLDYGDCSASKPDIRAELERLSQLKQPKVGFSAAELDAMSREDMCRVLHWAQFTKTAICSALQTWFRDRGLIDTK
jgi:superfamily II DNA or RNA helicase